MFAWVVSSSYLLTKFERLAIGDAVGAAVESSPPYVVPPNVFDSTVIYPHHHLMISGLEDNAKPSQIKAWTVD
jgi:hypothetical protein